MPDTDPVEEKRAALADQLAQILDQLDQLDQRHAQILDQLDQLDPAPAPAPPAEEPPGPPVATRYALPILADDAVISATPAYTRQLTARLGAVFDGQPGAPGPADGWADYGQPWPAAYIYTPANRTVTFFGLFRRTGPPVTLDAATAVEVAFVPEILRPVRNEIGFTFTSAGLARWDVTVTPGEPMVLTLRAFAGTTAPHIAANGFVSLGSISWRV